MTLEKWLTMLERRQMQINVCKRLYIALCSGNNRIYFIRTRNILGGVRKFTGSKSYCRIVEQKILLKDFFLKKKYRYAEQLLRFIEIAVTLK